MEYGWNIAKEGTCTFGSLSRELYYAGLLMDEIILENVTEVRRLLKGQGARADVVVPERGSAALHLLAGMEAEDFAVAVTLRALRQGADPDVRSEEGLTPTHVAATYGHCRVLEVLLTNGANPSLIDYRLLLDATEHAYRERQWQAFTMLTTYVAILDNELRFSKYLDPKDELLPADVSIYDEGVTNRAGDNSKRLVEDGVSCDQKGVSAYAVSMVQKHNRNVETYQYPIGEPGEGIRDFDEKPSDMSWPTSKFRGNKVEAVRNYLEDKLPWLNSPSQKHKRVESLECEDNNSSSKIILDLMDKPDLSQLSENDRDMESLKGSRPSPHLRDSEMYVYGYAASSGPQRGATDNPSDQESHVDHQPSVNSNMLCKMSRIFLFILKKRHSMSRTSIIGKYKEYSSHSIALSK